MLWVLDQLFDGELVEERMLSARLQDWRIPAALAAPAAMRHSRQSSLPVTLHSPLEANYTRSWVEKHSGLQLADSDEHAS